MGLILRAQIYHSETDHIRWLLLVPCAVGCGQKVAFANQASTAEELESLRIVLLFPAEKGLVRVVSYPDGIQENERLWTVTVC